MEDDNPKRQGLESVGKFTTGFSPTHLEVKVSPRFRDKVESVGKFTTGFSPTHLEVKVSPRL